MSQSLSIIRTQKKSAKSKDSDKILLWIPDSFDPKILLPPELQRYADCARYFLHRIHYGQVFGRLSETGFVRLKKEYMQHFIQSRRYNDLRRSLIASGAIECEVRKGKEAYSVGNQAKGYRLGTALRGSRWVRYEPTYSPLRRAIKKWREKDPRNRRLTTNYKFVVSNLKTISIDSEKANRVIASLGVDQETETILRASVDAIAHKDWHSSVCRYGRLHTNVTNLKSELRSCLTVDGQRLVNIDIRNSQPLFLCLLLDICRKNDGYLEHLSSYCPREIVGTDANFFSNDEIVSMFEKSEEKEEENGEEGGGTGRPHYVATFDLKSLPDNDLSAIFPMNPDNQDSFKTLCENGTLYDSFTGNPAITRGKAKKRLFSEVLYATNVVLEKSEFGKLFKERFPEVFEFITEVKRSDFANLSRLMQRYEAAFMFDRVIDRIRKEQPQTTIITIHDSILTTEDSADYVVSVLRDEFRQLGVEPGLRIERYAA